MKYWDHGIYKNTNATLLFDSNTGKATSYHVWNLLLKDKKGRYHLNEYKFSKTTSKHITQLKNVISGLGISWIPRVSGLNMTEEMINS